ncbi:alpha/beta fold hydrolase [Leptospira sp. GIMC2001]|uniref:alpha/beta fold hydrolase n=1 Tax=Leptospira sp. GIMC2001 TaxID=1513297 RepID=UPI00234B8443|nr:alpha/beta hydrolase [Leptospira sp. GIMC2001]WCL48136.1 alpha/beta hydrolase [Leptospira sp. GIMC2001]
MIEKNPKYRIESKSIDCNGISIFAKIWIPAKVNFTIPILCVHGLTGNHLSFARIAQGLVRRGHKVIAIDLRGRGQSDKPESDYSPSTHSKDIYNLLNELNIEKVNLIAHSLGAWISIEIATRYPWLVNRLVLLDGGGVTPIYKKWKNLKMVRLSLGRIGAKFLDPKDYLQNVIDSPFVDEMSDDLKNLLLYELEKVGEHWVCNIPEYVTESELASLGGAMKNSTLFSRILLHPIEYVRTMIRNKNLPYHKISCPTLIIRGLAPNLSKGDELIADSSLQAMLQKISKSVALTVPDKNHYGILLDSCPLRDSALNHFLEDVIG